MIHKTPLRVAGAAFTIAGGILCSRLSAYLIAFAIKEHLPLFAQFGLGFCLIGELLAYFMAPTWHTVKTRATFTMIMVIVGSPTLIWSSFAHWDNKSFGMVAWWTIAVELVTLVILDSREPLKQPDVSSEGGSDESPKDP